MHRNLRGFTLCLAVLGSTVAACATGVGLTDDDDDLPSVPSGDAGGPDARAASSSSGAASSGGHSSSSSSSSSGGSGQSSSSSSSSGQPSSSSSSSSSTSSSSGSACTPILTINEVQTAGASASDEFVEIYNDADCDAAFDGYKLVYQSDHGTTDSTLYNDAGTVPAHGFALFANAGYTGPGTPLHFTAGLAGGGGKLALKTDSGTVVDSMGYGTATGSYVHGAAAQAPGPSTSVGRSPDGASLGSDAASFVPYSSPTPGASND